jgi:hypothetical protein
MITESITNLNLMLQLCSVADGEKINNLSKRADYIHNKL